MPHCHTHAHKETISPFRCTPPRVSSEERGYLQDGLKITAVAQKAASIRGSLISLGGTFQVLYTTVQQDEHSPTSGLGLWPVGS